MIEDILGIITNRAYNEDFITNLDDDTLEKLKLLIDESIYSSTGYQNNEIKLSEFTVKIERPPILLQYLKNENTDFTNDISDFIIISISQEATEPKYYRISISYSSYERVDILGDYTEVKPVNKTVTIYE